MSIRSGNPLATSDGSLDRAKSLPVVFAKREYLRTRPETFAYFQFAFGDRGTWRQIRYAKSRDFQPISGSLGKLVRTPEWLADHPGIELPHSRLKKAL
jgi:hypothetical protein